MPLGWMVREGKVGSEGTLGEVVDVFGKPLQSGQFSDSGGTWHCRLGIADDHPDGGQIHNQGTAYPAGVEVGWVASGSPGCAMSRVVWRPSPLAAS